MINKEKEIAVINRGKVAFLYNNNLFEERIEDIEIDGKLQYAFIYPRNLDVIEKVAEYNENVELKKYNSCFKHVAMAIRKYKNK